MASSDIIKIGFDYRSSLAQFEKDTNGVFDGISSKAGKQKITIQLDAKDDKVIDKSKELQKLKLDKFTFEFGNSGLKEQLQTFDKLENKINEIINLSKGIGNSSAPIGDVNKSSKEIDKLESKLSELSKKYEELQKKSATGGISGKEVNLVDNDEFKKLSQEVSELKGQFDDLKTHMSLLDDYTVPIDRFFELQTQVEATSVKVSNLVNEMTRLSNVQKNIGAETNISSGSNPAIEQQNKLQEELKETQQQAEKARQSISELVKGRDVVSQNWYREKGTVVGKDSKGNDITRDADEFSFVERLKNGQLHTVIATYNEGTGKWVEQVINVRTAFEQVEKAIINTDNKINSLKISRNKTLAAHPGYDATADNNQIAIEQKKRNELQKTLNFYAQEKEYVFEIEAANKRIAENQTRLQNKSLAQSNLQSAKDNENIYNKQLEAVREIAAQKKKAQEADRQTNVDIALKNQLTAYREIQNIRLKISQTNDTSLLSELEHQKKIYQEQYLASTKILRNNSDLYNSEKRLNELKQIGLKTTLKIAENKVKENALQVDATNTANAKSIQSKWEQAEKAIQNYMNAVTKLNNLKASDKSTGKKSYEIAGQIEEIEKLKKEAYDTRQVLSSMINPQNVDTDTWKRYVDVINRLDQASNGSAESVNRLKDSLKNTLNSELNSLQNSIDKYQNIITQAQTYPSDFHPSTEYNTRLAKLESANEVLKNYKASLQGVNELTKEQQNQINRLTQNCEKAATEFKNLSASEKGTIKVGVEKAIQRINKDLAENTKYSAKAKAGLNALLKQLESGDPSINLRKITEEIIKIENAEIAAGRAGKSLWDIFKTKSTYGFIGQMQSYLSMYVGFYGMVNGVKKAVSTITELDTALVDLKKTTAMNENQLENFYYDSNNVAKQMGVTTKEIIDQASAWSRLGYNTAETSTTMAKLSSQFASISPGMSVDESQSGLVSIMKAKLYALIYSNVYLEYI